MARTYGNKAFPGNPAELAEMLADPAQAAKAMGGTQAQWRQFNAEYAARASDAGIDVQIREQVQAEVANMLRADGKAGSGGRRLNLDPNAIPMGRNALYNKRAPGAKADEVLNGSSDRWADFFGGIHHGNRTEAAASMQSKLVKIQNLNDYGSAVPSDGGFLVPEVLRAEILSLALEQSIVRPRARVIPMSSLRVPIPAIDSTSHESTLFGGLSVVWSEESGQLTGSSAKFARVVLEASKMALFADVPNELVDDAPAFGAFLEMAFPATLAFEEDSAFLTGTGVGQPLGVLNGSGLITVAKETSQEADTIVWENIVAMYARMLPGSLSKAVWVVSPDCFPELMTMGLSIGTGGSAVWAANTDGTSGPPATLLGRPVLVSEKAEKLGDAGDVSFIDFGHYLIGDRQAMTMKSSEHFRFQNDQTSFRAIQRVDGRPWISTALTPRNGGDTLSPYVTLGARA